VLSGSGIIRTGDGTIHYHFTDVIDGHGGTVTAVVATESVVVTESRIPINVSVTVESGGGTNYNVISTTHKK
jgi:hypothetical protein